MEEGFGCWAFFDLEMVLSAFDEGTVVSVSGWTSDQSMSSPLSSAVIFNKSAGGSISGGAYGSAAARREDVGGLALGRVSDDLFG